ncbi:MAG: hypothetical protein GQ533_01065 [Methanosarcinaceae archaeon]|nr:hypothetical protein [Methanosarcinaceae archaeon]
MVYPIVKISSTACDTIKGIGDIEISAMPDIRIAIALEIKNVCLMCIFFQIVLYVSERIAIVLKYPLKINGTSLNAILNE